MVIAKCPYPLLAFHQGSGTLRTWHTAWMPYQQRHYIGAQYFVEYSGLVSAMSFVWTVRTNTASDSALHITASHECEGIPQLHPGVASMHDVNNLALSFALQQLS